jgi:hypothetical protein
MKRSCTQSIIHNHLFINLILMARGISSRMQFLIKFGILPAEAWDFVIPHGPKFSTATKEYAMAGVVRDIALNLTDRALQKKLLATGKSMVEFASKGLVNAWQEGDDICPPWWPPFPWPGPGPTPEPDPVPWFIARHEGITEYANALKVIAGISAVPAVTKQLNEIANTLSTQSMGG